VTQVETMSDNQLPMEVELVYEVMPCNALRVAQQPGATPHPCSYFRKWGNYHSYDYPQIGPPQQGTVVNLPQYVYAGRAPLVPELVSGCRKAPIMAVGINPNLTGWFPTTSNAIYPWFDDYKQFAHYFRYRRTQKLDIPRNKFTQYPGSGEGPLTHTTPPQPNHHGLDVLHQPNKLPPIPAEPLDVKMYQNYESLLGDLATAMSWTNHKLALGEDVSYGNMVACPSAKWLNAVDPANPDMPPMTASEQRGIVQECFHKRRYFLRQLFHSLPQILMVFSQNTANAFIGEMTGRFTEGDPQVGERIDDLIQRKIFLKYGTAHDGTVLQARVIFSPHITGDPAHFQAARQRVLNQLIDEAQAGRITYNPQSGHLSRPVGSCSFCTSLAIGPCDYLTEITSLQSPPLRAAAGSTSQVNVDKAEHERLLDEFLAIGSAHRAAGPRVGAATAPASPGANALPPVFSSAAQAGWDLAGNPQQGPADV
jgi:hypothetical protein